MKFSTRDLMLVTIIAAVLTAWWVDRAHLHQENSKLRELLEGRVHYTAYPPGRPTVGVWIGDY